jgi:hypothetical protein
MSYTREYPAQGATTDVSTPAANTAAVVTYAAAASYKAHLLHGIYWSYSGVPTGGNVKVEDGSGNVIFSADITAAGPGFLPFNPPRRGTKNRAMIITLAAGGDGISGKLSLSHDIISNV